MSGKTEKTADKDKHRDAETVAAKAGAETAAAEDTDAAEAEAGEAAAADNEADTDNGADAPEAESEDMAAKYMRLAADFQNYKKRTEKERFERYAEGKKDLAADILPVLDNFERAVAGETGQDEAVTEGLEMILRQLRDVLAKNGITEIEALGADFDPNRHHAVMMEDSQEYESGKVCEVLQKGYAVGDKIVRPAMVKVAQ
ncbi:MAG: nucleotide exchange factor GrpE [Clostridiales Family XIII bacterium]|jgi:molecular chaperone GrpE|nr:nucleotide exchange factor GrpE [Clostridiales Family XIII bacterium]